MDFIAKKYTVLMNNEPIELWIKNNEIKKSKFMDKKISLNLSEEIIRKIKDNPSRTVNGSNFISNIEFTKSVSKMMDDQLKLAIAKNDRKTLSRFARSELVPDANKEAFIEAINRQSGIRGVLTKAVNKTNAIFQNLAKKIDRYFDKVKENVSNKKLDKYLEEYQLKEFNKAPPLKDIDLNKNVDAKLQDMAKDFVEKNNITELNDSKTNDKLLQNDFMSQAVRAGLNPIEAKTALAQTILKNQHQEEYIAKSSQVQDMTKIIDELQSKLNIFEKKEAFKNETIEDFKILTKDMSAVDKIDILIENKEYLNMNEAQKLDIENKLLYQQEPIQERAIEVKEIAKVIDSKPKFETVYNRASTLNFSDKNTQNEVKNEWSKLQKINREQKAQNRDFMNISAIKFNGVSEKALENWKNYSQGKGADKDSTQKFVNASIRNAKELVKIGVMKEATKGEYKFVDTFAKESLFKNLDKPVQEIEKANQGKSVQVELNPKSELKDRIQTISSEKSFEKLLNGNGQIDSQKLHEFADNLQTLATQLHNQEKANSSAVTMDDLKQADRGKSQENDNSQQRA